MTVLVLSCCVFNFVSPPFLHCHTLKFLGLDRCTSNNTNELQAGNHTSTTKWWACLQSLCVIDLRYTDWVGIFHEEKALFGSHYCCRQQLRCTATTVTLAAFLHPSQDRSAEVAERLRCVVQSQAAAAVQR
uniref:Uncharacterized protein n=1 Tax=Leersia perrieri TaxID=77586 RepID=A0A0D9X9J9_9ORYZ